MDLVDEEHVVGLERRQDRRHVGLAVDGRARHDPQRRGHLGRDDGRERRLAEAREGRPGARARTARPRRRAASRKIESCSLICSWPTNSARLRGRSERSNSSSPGARSASGIRAPAAALTRPPGRDGAREREPHALLDREGLVDVAAAPPRPRRPTCPARPARRAPRCGRRRRRSAASPSATVAARPPTLSLRSIDDPLGGAPADAGDAREEGVVAGLRRPAGSGRARSRTRSRAPPWARRRTRPAGARTATARPRGEAEQLRACPRARAGA